MRINSIDIKNYRQYQNLSLFFPESSKNDVHIIIAQNGVGKTNLLNAITWCLYSKEPHLGSEDKDQGLPKLNLAARRQAYLEGRNSEVIEVTIRAQDGDQTLTYNRTMPCIINEFRVFEEVAKERFMVTVSTISGDVKVYEGEEALNYVNRYMPEKVREYFYFDGEQLNNYFMGARKAKIREAIFDISQVDIVNRIYKRLDDIIKDKQKEAGAKTPNIQKINDELQEVDRTLIDLKRKIESLNEEIEKSQVIIKNNTEFLQDEDNLPELENRFQGLKKKQEGLLKSKKELMDSTFAFVREMKIVLTFYSAAKTTLELIARKEAEGALPPNIDKDLLEKSLRENICSVCNQPLSVIENNIIKELIESFQVSSDTSHLLMSIRSELERNIQAAQRYKKEKEHWIKEHQKVEAQLDEVGVELDNIDKVLNRIGNKEEVRLKHQERFEHEVLLRVNTEKLGVFKDQCEKANFEKIELQKEFDKEIAKEKECNRLKQLIDFANKGRSVIFDVEKEVMEEVRKRMEERTTHYFNELVWKKNTYEYIKLDEEFQLDLIHKDGYSSVGTISAAERALLALSFTLALHDVSDFNSLLFIDTPVARVSDTNRLNFANVLSEVSRTKQLIMTFTPDEYSPGISNIFDNVAKTKIDLELDNEEVIVIKQRR